MGLSRCVTQSMLADCGISQNFLIKMIGIALGDVTGIGPEVALKALAAEAQEDDFRCLLIGDAELLSRLNLQLGLHLPLKPLAESDRGGRFFTHNPFNEPLPQNLPAGSPVA